MSGSTLVSTGELAANLRKWRVFDCRHDLAKPELGEQQYREGHIPGALFAHLDRDLSGHEDRQATAAIRCPTRRTSRNGWRRPASRRRTRWSATTPATARWPRACGGCCAGSATTRSPCSTAASPSGRRKAAPVTIDVPLFTPLNYPIKLRKDFAVDVAHRRAESRQASCFSMPALPRAIAASRSRSTRSPGRIPGAKNRFNMRQPFSRGNLQDPPRS